MTLSPRSATIHTVTSTRREAEDYRAALEEAFPELRVQVRVVEDCCDKCPLMLVTPFAEFDFEQGRVQIVGALRDRCAVLECAERILACRARKSEGGDA